MGYRRLHNLFHLLAGNERDALVGDYVRLPAGNRFSVVLLHGASGVGFLRMALFQWWRQPTRKRRKLQKSDGFVELME